MSFGTKDFSSLTVSKVVLSFDSPTCLEPPIPRSVSAVQRPSQS
jgi:hypothetical protein